MDTRTAIEIFSRCPLCQQSGCARHLSIGGYAVRACPYCRIEFLDPQPEDSILAAIYGDHYFLGAQDDAAAARRAQMKTATAALYIDALTRIVPAENAALLEIGCGQGEVLLEARRRGFRVAGLEISEHAAAAANRQLGEPWVRTGSIEAMPAVEGPFDAILAADVIEHMRDPQAFLMRARELLRPGGVLLLITPSLDSWTRRMLRARWMEYKLEHLFYFRRASVYRLLERYGFEEILIRPNRKVLTIDYLSRHFERYRVPLLSASAGALRRVVPEHLAHRHLLLPAGGLLAIARKSPGTWEERSTRIKCSIIVAVFNECKTFSILMDALLKKQMAKVDREIIVIESNSTDGTRELAQQYRSHPEVKLVLQDRPRGKGHAIREGFGIATGDVVLIQDADLEYDLGDYDALLEPILAGRAHFVLGTRHCGDRKIRQFARQKGLAAALNFGHAFFTGLINVLYRQSMTDPFTMFKVFRRDCLAGLEFHCNRFDFDHELVIKLVRKGYRPLEVPVNYRSRSFREGKKVRLFRDPLTWLWVDLKLRFTRVARPEAKAR